MLVLVIIFIFENLKDYLMKIFTVLTTSDHSLNPQLSFLGNKISVEFKGSCLKQDKITYTLRKIVKIYITYKISKNFHISTYSTSENCLFGAKNADFLILMVGLVEM